MSFQVLVAFFIGTLFAHVLHWNPMEGIFLGAICSISSSMVAIPILKNKDALKQPYAQFTIGVAVLEDILAVLLLVILSNVGQGYFNWKQCFNLLFWISVFIASMIFFGRLVAQRFMSLLHRIHNEEIIHVCVVGIILLLSSLASAYSNALGAFLAGVIFSSTRIVGRLESMIAPIRDVFTAVFFVAIGILIDPKVLWEQKYVILVLSLLVVLGQCFSVWLGFFLSGQKSSSAFRAALPKSQIGEFSFVLAALAESLGVSHGNLMAITVGTALLTIIAANVLCMKEDSLLAFFDRIIPQGVKTWSSVYQNILQSVQNHISGSRFWIFVRRPLLKIVIQFSLVNAIVWCNAWLCGLIAQYPGKYTLWVQRGMTCVTLIFALPFIGSLVRNINLVILGICKTTLRNLFQRLNHHPAIYQLFQLFIIAVAIFIFAWSFLGAAANIMPTYMPIVTIVLLCLILGVAFWRQFRKINSQIECMFLESFNTELESDKDKRNRAMMKVVTQKHPWDVQIKTYIVGAHSHVVGERLAEVPLRQQTGATILGISRGGFLSYDVRPDMMFFPEDHIILLGNEQQLQQAENFFDIQQVDKEVNLNDLIDFEQIIITPDNPLANETVASADVRKRYGVNIVGIQRKDLRIEQLQAQDIFKVGDNVLVVGSPKNIKKLKTVTAA